MYLDQKGEKVMFKCEIETGNAAFCDPYTGEENNMDEALELKRILKEICEKLEYGETSGTIMDINGNKVGKWSRQECNLEGRIIMWIFEAKYDVMDLESSIKSIKRKIEFDGDNFFDTEAECYHYAMSKALKMKQKNECLGNLEFIAC